jgi:hypothetical protein
VLRGVVVASVTAAGAFARDDVAGFFSADEVLSTAVGVLGAATAFLAAAFFEGALEDFLAAFFAIDFFAAFFPAFFTLFLAAFFGAFPAFFAVRFFVAAFLVARAGEVLRAFLALFFLEVFLAFATTNFL